VCFQKGQTTEDKRFEERCREKGRVEASYDMGEYRQEVGKVRRGGGENYK
jgi:hypothetical protein